MKQPNKSVQEISVTPEGWLYIVILSFISVGAVLRNVNLLILMSGMMIAPLIINWRLGKMRARTLSAKRSLPYRAHAKSVAAIQWLCFNRSPLAAWGIEMIDTVAPDESELQRRRLPPAAESDPLAPPAQVSKRWLQALKEAARWSSQAKSIYNLQLALPTVGGNQQEVLTGRVYFSQRGVYRFGPAQLTSRFPFGLISLNLDIDQPELLYVAPQLGKLTPVWDRRVRSILAGADALMKRRGLAGDDFYALRRWRSGDSRKLIHWRTSAKYGFPIVKQFEQPDNRDFALLLDLWVPADSESDSNAVPSQAVPSQAVSSLAACETALSFASTVILSLGAAVKGRIGFAVCGTETTVLQSRSQRDLLEGAMRAMAVAQATAQPEVASSLIGLADSVAPNTPLIVVSSRPPVDFFTADFDSDSLEQNALRNLWHSVVWLHVESPEFAELFQLEGDDQELQALAAKWSAHVSD